MNQSDLDRAVAQATGETVSTIQRLGFLLAGPDEQFDLDEHEDDPYVIDWDELERQRRQKILRSRRHESAAV